MLLPAPRLSLLLLAAASLVGCPGARQAKRCPITATRLAGSWDAVVVTDENTPEATRIDRHELQLYAHEGQLVGFWDQAVSWRSRDGRPFACGGQQQLQLRRRLQVGGAAFSGYGSIQLQAAPWHGRSCAPGPSSPADSCQLRIVDSELLALRCGPQTLRLSPRLSRRIPLDLSRAQQGHVTGVWIWTHRSEDVDGDLKLEEETWQLRQLEQTISGHYDRLVQVRSGDGRRFQCNGALRYESRARFWVAGTAAEGRIQLHELRYSTARTPCEQGKRSLDSYSGKLSQDNQQLELSWGQGRQTLSRRY